MVFDRARFHNLLDVRRYVPGTIVGLILIAAGGPGAAAPATGPTFELNVISPVTGSGAFLGKSYAESWRAIEEVVNASGGIGGRRLKIVIADSQTNGQVDLQLVNGLIANRIAVFVDGGPSPACNASVPVVVRTGPVDYCLSPVIHPPAGSFVFSASASTADLAKTAVRYVRARGWTRVAMMTSTDSTGQDYDREIDAALQLPENANVILAAREHFNPSDLSAVAQVTRLKAAGPQAVMVWATGTPLGTVLRGLKDVGLDTPVITNNSNMTYAQMTAYSGFLPAQLYFPALRGMLPEGTGKGPLREAQTQYANAFRAIGVKPDLGHNLAWDPTMIVIDALRKFGPSASAEQVRDHILHLHGWVGVNGVYDFSGGDQRGIGQSSLAIARWDGGRGTWVQVSQPGGAPR